LNNLYKITKKTWKLFFKTDHKEYFEFVLEELKKTKWKLNLKTYDYEKEGLYVPSEITEFEQIFRWQNIKINYLEAEK
jgi:tRNA G46 methylase TrmB